MKLCDVLSEFFEKSDSPILFAGAGVSVKANLPTWGKLIENLAEAVRPYDHLSRHIILERIKEKDLLNAASYYFLCKKIPEAEKYSLLRNQFKEYQPENIKSLTSLPFESIITTNYDRALHDAYAASLGKAPLDFSLGEPALKGAPFESDFYIARIHGRSEFPESIILSEQHYKDLKNHEEYINLLTYIFTRKQILFVGFSFLDPAIRSVLDTINKHYGKEHKGRHLAILPETSDSEFVTKLESFTIQKVFYKTEDSHAELWSCFEDVNEKLKQQELNLVSRNTDPFSSAKKYLASCYARVKLGPKIYPLKKAIAEGIVSNIISRSGNSGAKIEEIVASVHTELSINKDESERLTRDALDALKNEKLCAIKGDRITWIGESGSVYEDAITQLAEGVLNRLVVREGGEYSEDKKKCIEAALKNLVLVRGWDLGAAFAANKVPDDVDIENLIFNVKECNKVGSLNELYHSLVNLIGSPSEKEAKLLTELGRMAFALELILQTPHDSLFHSLTLPEKIYLDANVLMPAVTYGHPFHNLYRETIDSLIETASKSNVKIKVIAYYGFLNEVVSHKKLAQEEFNTISQDGKYLDDLVNQAKLFGVQNLNVFVGGYVTLLANKEKLTFEKYLSRYAPYNSEKQLAAWLEKQGINIISENQMKSMDSQYAEILHTLEVKYSSNVTWRAKDAVLIRHDALQMAAVNSDIKNGIRSIFVTADRRLRENLENGKFSNLTNSMVSHVGLTQLIDLLVGSLSDEQNVSRLIWGTRLSNETEIIRNYLIDHALSEYDDAVAMAMHQVVDDVSEGIIEKIGDEGLSLQSNSCTEKAGIVKIIGSFENRFFEEMRKIIEKRRKED